MPIEPVEPRTTTSRGPGPGTAAGGVLLALEEVTPSIVGHSAAPAVPGGHMGEYGKVCNRMTLFVQMCH
ncbi:hypothetical protein GCM10009678_28470 [Actinomadura kijaniata]